MPSPTKRRSPTTTTRSNPPSKKKARTRATNETKSSGFPIVGIGASAGGLEAFSRLLKALPVNTGMGFVLVQHLDPVHESALTQLLARATSMPVRAVTDNLRVEANHVYVIPPNSKLRIAQGRLKLQPRGQPAGAARSIDFFFESLAQDQGVRAIGVILSGTASDGTAGLEAIKAEGGITFAQDASAKYDSMPHSAVAAGCVDFVLSPEGIAKELARIAAHPYVAGEPPDLLIPSEEDRAPAQGRQADAARLPSRGRGAAPMRAKEARADAVASHEKWPDNGYKKILLLLRNHSGVDFALYKSKTIQRRITRRMVLGKHDTVGEYADFLRGNAKELDALFSDALISVTSFFRNPEAFEDLARTVFPSLLRQQSDQPIRVWVLGCSTGQEAYSIAMAFMESAEYAARLRKLQIFATDLNDTLLDKARHGLYAKNLAQDISAERLRRFFVEEGGGYQVSKSLREMVVFARQNLISDPPFSRMDIISCRNLLIYLDPRAQKKAIPMFHYALKPGGVLWLGASESIGEFTQLFEVADKKQKMYRKRAVPTSAFHFPVKEEHNDSPSPGLRPPEPPPIAKERVEEPSGAPERFHGEPNAQREADRVTVNRFAPPGVLINADLQILQFRGPTNAYLEPPKGKATFDVLRMAREGLMLPFRAAISKAKRENTAVRKEHVLMQHNGRPRTVNLEVIPLKNMREQCFLVVFEEVRAGRPVSGALSTTATPPRRGVGGGRLRAKGESRRVAELERELAETRDYLHSLQEQHEAQIEEFEASNEEIQSANEEVQSANEELQSINEELETSKEELESANEELMTVNEEMVNRNEELGRLMGDVINLQNATKMSIILVGRDLTVRRFSAQAEKQFNLLAIHIGRPIGNVRHTLDLPDLENLIAEVIDTIREHEREVRDSDGRWYSLRVRPYLTVDNKVDGAVLVLMDIDLLKRSEEAIAAGRDFAESVIDTVREPLVVLDAELRVESANRAFYRTFQATPAEMVGRFMYEVGHRRWDVPRLRSLLEEVLPMNSVIEDFLVEQEVEHLGRRSYFLNARRIHDPVRNTERILLAMEDITLRRQATETQAKNHAELQSNVDELSRFNRAAVGREIRMIELKKEINELCRRHGEPARYALDFEQEGPAPPGGG